MGPARALETSCRPSQEVLVLRCGALGKVVFMVMVT